MDGDGLPHEHAAVVEIVRAVHVRKAASTLDTAFFVRSLISMVDDDWSFLVSDERSLFGRIRFVPCMKFFVFVQQQVAAFRKAANFP